MAAAKSPMQRRFLQAALRRMRDVCIAKLKVHMSMVSLMRNGRDVSDRKRACVAPSQPPISVFHGPNVCGVKNTRREIQREIM
jgi:hypothetical protein